jgi:hypothetical protein
MTTEEIIDELTKKDIHLLYNHLFYNKNVKPLKQKCRKYAFKHG